MAIDNSRNPRRVVSSFSGILVALLVILGLVVVVFFGINFYRGYRYHLSWVGVSQSTITRHLIVRDKVEPVDELQPAKTLWDWAQLLIIPILVPSGLLLVGYFLNDQVRKRDIALEQDKQRESMLKAYFDTLGNLINESGVSKVSDLQSGPRKDSSSDPGQMSQAAFLGPGSATATFVRALTLATLSRLDGQRKGDLLRFLIEARLVQEDAETLTTTIDLRDADLSNAILKSLSLKDVSLWNVNLEDADMRWADLRGASIFETTRIDNKWKLVWQVSNDRAGGRDLRNCDLTNADLRGASFYNSQLQGANLTGSLLDMVDFKMSQIDANTRMDSKAKLVWEIANHINTIKTLKGLDLSSVSLRFVLFGEVSLENTNLLLSDLSSSSFFHAPGVFAALAKFVKLNKFCTLDPNQKVNLSRAGLSRADFSEAVLPGANFRDANCVAAIFNSAIATNADFSNADLGGSKFDNADLGNAILDCALLFDADFRKAKNLTSEQVAKAIGDVTTLLPDDINRPKDWPTGKLDDQKKAEFVGKHRSR